MSNWKFLNDHRARIASRYVPLQYCTDDSFGFCGLFRFQLDGHSVRCVVSDDGGWQHVSVSLEHEAKTPSWSLMSKIKELFWEPEDAVIQIHPPASEHVNMHEYCLHLWKCTDGREQPLPPSIYVGIKGLKVKPIGVQ
jgi:hypothetical protein